MILGFTGTSKGMTQKQRDAVRYLLAELPVTYLHHGDCVGADAQVHRDAASRGIKITVHPPSDAKKRAFCVDGGEDTVILPTKPYLSRNRDIVTDGVHGLIAAPKNFTPPENLRGQGTWTTIKYAREAKRPTWIVFPDGTFKAETYV